MTLTDRLGRPLRNLRLSVTDRCNLRCEYCMPEDQYAWLQREDVLHFEEVSEVVDAFLALGVNKIRLTGGEPLLRRDLPTLVRMVADKPGIADLALTTNGVLLSEQIDALTAAGLRRITVSLDTLKRDRFAQLTRFDELDAVRRGMAAASRVFGHHPAAPDAPPEHRFKIDTVVIRGVNDDEVGDLVEFGIEAGAEVRFIEYMDVGGATRWSAARVVPKTEILERLTRRFGRPDPLPRLGPAPADRFRLPNGVVVGVIASTTEPFCATCDRSRLTADGLWFLCLYATRGLDLRAALRGGATGEAIRTLIEDAWRARTDCGAEDRLALGDRRAFVPIAALRTDPHLEMHTRGG